MSFGINSRNAPADSRGFSLIEVMITASLFTVVALAASTVVIGVGRAMNATASQSSNVALANAIRVQLARRATCALSMSPPPDFTSGGDVSVIVNGETVVRANADLPDWKVTVQSLTMRNLTNAGPDLNGNVVYLGDVVLRSVGRDQATAQRTQFQQVNVARVAMEVRGGAMTACYAADALNDTTEQFRQTCSMTTSSDGVAATWTGSSCTVPDNRPPTTCATLGGSWTGSSCAILVQNYAVNQGQDYGAAGNTWYPAYCPGGYKATGVFQLSGSGPSAPLYGMIGTNAAWSSWPAGFEYTQFVYSGECVR